jgi:hypothetical protein
MQAQSGDDIVIVGAPPSAHVDKQYPAMYNKASSITCLSVAVSNARAHQVRLMIRT